MSYHVLSHLRLYRKKYYIHCSQLDYYKLYSDRTNFYYCASQNHLDSQIVHLSFSLGMDSYILPNHCNEYQSALYQIMTCLQAYDLSTQKYLYQIDRHQIDRHQIDQNNNSLRSFVE